MTADILILPIVRVERPEPPPEPPLVLHLHPRTARRLRAYARDCRVDPADLAVMLLEKILFPETIER